MMTAEVKENEGVFLSSYALLEERMAGASWLRSIRRAARERFAVLGLPTVRQEEWKYTNVAPLGKIGFRPAELESVVVTAAQIERLPLSDVGGSRLVFINGRYDEELSRLEGLPEGIRVGSLAEALESGAPSVKAHLARYASYEDRPFVALNTAFIRDGAFIEVPEGMVVEQPIHLLFVSAGGDGPLVSHPRNLILVGAGGQASIIEAYAGMGSGLYLTNPVTEMVLGENAVVDHYRLQQEDEQAFHIGTLQAEQGRASSLYSHNVSLGGALVRNDINVVLAAEGDDCTLDGLYLAAGNQHVDNHTTIDHAKPHGSSRELYKGILDGRATAVFNGSVIVRKDAQKTDARQSNKNLLLSEEAEINTKPELQILADDVKCSHGATIGQIDREALFYLRSRGIGQDEARSLLTYAFANEILDRIKVEPVRARLEAALHARLSGARKSEEGL
ncbi:MAG TPA: Fe-S cluster assembly protein SufD [Blastocatellia bacterium]|nr:Fe-S cluster assembly protein SufD [Blastocatellia bacterium]